jgi:hypothetical protein
VGGLFPYAKSTTEYDPAWCPLSVAIAQRDRRPTDEFPRNELSYSPVDSKRRCCISASACFCVSRAVWISPPRSTSAAGFRSISSTPTRAPRDRLSNAGLTRSMIQREDTWLARFAPPAADHKCSAAGRPSLLSQRIDLLFDNAHQIQSRLQSRFSERRASSSDRAWNYRPPWQRFSVPLRNDRLRAWLMRLPLPIVADVANICSALGASRAI